MLVILFEKADLNTFFDLLVLLKLCTAAATCSIFLQYRFRNQSALFTILLSISYALMQYNIAQSSNIMWLDGVYMLPLILLGVYQIFQGKSIRLLSITIALSILFNWYSAGINCLFSGLWCIMECLMAVIVHHESNRSTLQKLFHYFLGAAIGVGISACLFLPTIFGLMEGKGSIGWNGLSLGFLGNILTLISNLTISATSARGSVSLYTGSLAIIGLIAYFVFIDEKHRYEKIIHGIFAAAVVLIFYWGPLCFVFSLFRSVGSYWYRYSYVGCFSIIYLAGCFYSRWSEYEESVLARTLLKCGVGISLALLFLDYGNSVYPFKYTSITVLVYLFLPVALIAYNRFGGKQLFKSASMIIVVIAVAADLGTNTYLLAKRYRVTGLETDITYIREEEKLIQDLKSYDGSFYRVNQTLTRHRRDENLTANYNEAAAYGYASISGYTSAPENIQLDFLNNLGYRMNGSAMNIVNTSIIPADSLLGVKYILSNFEIPGLKRVDPIQGRNGKYVYENPYSLPAAFVYQADHGEGNIKASGNPFLFINECYSGLLGEHKELFQQVSFYEKQDGNRVEYVLSPPSDKDIVLYGNIRTSGDLNASLYINDVFQTGYSKWLAPSVFYIPINNQDEIRVRLSAEGRLNNITDVQFYSMNLTELEQISEQISSRKAEDISIKNGNISGTIMAEKGDFLYLSVPYHPQWKILCNGKRIEPVLFGNCLMSIPLDEGENIIEMSYTVRGLKQGILITLCSIIVLIWLPERYYRPSRLNNKRIRRFDLSDR